jgi:hypothetical protein
MLLLFVQEGLPERGCTSGVFVVTLPYQTRVFNKTKGTCFSHYPANCTQVCSGNVGLRKLIEHVSRRQRSSLSR